MIFFFFWWGPSKRSSATVTAHSYTVNFSAPEKKKERPIAGCAVAG